MLGGKHIYGRVDSYHYKKLLTICMGIEYPKEVASGSFKLNSDSFVGIILHNLNEVTGHST